MKGYYVQATITEKGKKHGHELDTFGTSVCGMKKRHAKKWLSKFYGRGHYTFKVIKF